ncbi:uncharacterized protein TRIADDRAFT_55397 [Trichoplax adhaerens]|uniref:Large ribosomal subunit protein mL42 n=1 Tax=Trichoplax adhaerens TaxID=10228 RepID=B3RUS7_TRIAD|nr:predicted protein [Trichoplax adhaerens]EDV25375.1 predicted protein [Trichoplax adhaerens]|eukprot:XP_002111408.1 predicted protein [Trichoplax adhaerens]
MAASSSLNAMRYQAITSDGRIFVCYHPDKKFPIEYTKSLQKLNDPWENMNDTMTKAQIQESLRLKADEPGIWGSKLLGRLFNIKPSAVREHVRLTKEQRKTLEQENKALKFFRPHKRRLYRRLLHLHRRKRLEEEAEKLKFTGQQ